MRRRIVVLAVLAATLATVLFGVPLAVGVSQYFLGDERGEVERVADAAAITVADDLAEGRAVRQLPAQQGDIALALYGPSGRRIEGAGPGAADAVVRQARDATDVAGRDDVNGELVVAVPVTDGPQVTGVVRAASDYSSVRWQIAGTWAVMAGLAALAVAATWLVARWQARRLVRPLEALSRTAVLLGGGDFSVRTAESGIPEIDSAGSSLNTTADRLGSLISRERAFSADASHQLRTPLTGLRLGLETALDAPDADLRAAIGTAIESADRLERTIEDLLSLAREPRRRGAPLDMAALTDEARETWGPVLAARGRQLRLERSPHAPVSTAAPAAVRQALWVLLDNAVQHGAGTVTVTVREAGGALAVDVADEGHGPLDDARSKGQGIGLGLARSLAEAEGGRLRLTRPAPPVFTLLLPAGPEDADTPMDGAATTAPAVDESPGRRFPDDVRTTSS